MPITPLDEPAAIRGKAKRMTDRLRKYYNLGEKLNYDDSPSIKKFARRKGFTSRTMRAFRAFARSYDKNELETLCSRQRDHSGLPLHWGFIPHLLAVEAKRHRETGRRGGKAARRRFERLVEANSWTVPELQAAIAREYYPIRAGYGRSMKCTSSPAAALEQLVVELEGCIGRSEAIMGYLTEKAPGASVTKLNQRVEVVRRAMKTIARRARLMARRKLKIQH
jgi:hypothetical protein